ncbi:hypothetical protein [Vibrio intestinalis]|uniref:hypothetical protein n=1 Tax=Vibrio intestinalis TaxID=2933291 RepID=UPI0021A37BC7|nr:hypothetical protein [Vibrio intestinalis]
MKLFWWNLNNREKAKRSFILAPFFLTFALLPNEIAPFPPYSLIVAIGAALLMVGQGFYYKHKADKEVHK